MKITNRLHYKHKIQLTITIECTVWIIGHVTFFLWFNTIVWRTYDKGMTVICFHCNCFNCVYIQLYVVSLIEFKVWCCSIPIKNMNKFLIDLGLLLHHKNIKEMYTFQNVEVKYNYFRDFKQTSKSKNWQKNVAYH